MNYVLWRTSTGVFLILLLAAVLSTGVAQAQTSGGKAAQGDNEVRLTKEQRTNFVRGAKTVGGLNDQQVARALKSPEILERTPVKTRTTSSEKVIASPKVSGGIRPQAASRNPYADGPICRQFTTTKEMLDLNDKTTLRFTTYKIWCFDGKRVLPGQQASKTPIPTMKVVPWIRPDLRKAPGQSGYIYNKAAQKGTDKFVTYDGRWHGGHRSIRQGRFDWRVPGEDKSLQIVRANNGRIGTYDGRCKSAGPVYEKRLQIITP